jgi:hypothetical protein
LPKQADNDFDDCQYGGGEQAEYPIKRDMGSPSVDHSVRPGYVASMRAAAVHAVGPGTRSIATIALVMSTSSSKSVSPPPMTL